VESFLLGESGRVDGLEARQRLTCVFEIVGNCLIREIAQPIVVAIVTNLSGKFRLRTQRVLPLIGEQTIEFCSPRFERLLGSVDEERDDETQGKIKNHERCSQDADLGSVINTPSKNIRKRAPWGSPRVTIFQAPPIVVSMHS